VDPTYYAAFAWALLDSIADTNVQPPKLRPHREMRCITRVQNEAVRRLWLYYAFNRLVTSVRTIILQNMIRDYVKTKRVRAALSIENEMMQRIPEVTTYTPLLVGWIH
jgi:hypothetical protein